MRARRGFVVVAVLIIVLVTLLVATGGLHIALADRAASSNLERATQGRMLAWSGLQIVMDDLYAERDRVLEGERPRLDNEFVIYETATRLGVVRLVPVGPGEETLVAESGKHDLNTVEAAELVATGFVSDTVAQRIVDERAARGGFVSVADLLLVDGVTAEALWGPLDEVDTTDRALGAELGLGERVAARLSGPEPRGLADIVTVFAVEPLLQRSGDLRISLQTEWSDELGSRIDERFGAGASGAIKGLFDQGERFAGDQRICQLLNQFDVELEQWPDFLDGLTGEPDELVFGRLDINTASEIALAAVEAIGPDAAARIVSERATLDDGEKATIDWPARADILDRAVYDELGGRLTTRCWTWRIRIAAGEVDAEEPDGPLSNPVIWEAVIDLADPTPRIAYLRDITLLQTAARLVARSDTDDAGAEERADAARFDLPDDSEGPATLDDLGFDEPAGLGDLGFDEPAGFGDLGFDEPAGFGDIGFDPPEGDPATSGAADQEPGEDDASAEHSGEESGEAAEGSPPRGRRVGRWIGQ